ncbi:hypothetical protein K438DRAFT_1761409 [Mycena galopus ATCC 62051]|nr:hypothetical protein K438DRAFT_1761409 [Mycena galopus ATCC 62051]
MSDSNKVKNRAQLRKAKHRLALRKYAERLRESRKNPSSEARVEARAATNYHYRDTKRRQKYIDAYGSRSYDDFYRPLCEFFWDGTLTSVTLVDDTMQPRKKSF